MSGAGEPPLRLAFLADPNSIHTRRWVGWFARAGHDVRLIDPFGTTVAADLPDGVTVVAYGPLPRTLPLIGLRARRSALRDVLDSVGPQVLHAMFVRRYGWLAALSGFHPLVVSPWGSDLLRVRPHQLRTRWWNRIALRAADLVTVSSEGMRDVSVRAGANPDRIEHIHHGVDTDHFAPGPPDPGWARRIGATGAPVILSPRTIRPLYRHEVVIDALARVTTDEHRPVLVLSARGADPAYLGAIRERAARTGIGQQVRVLDDVPHEELPSLFRLADVIVSVPETDSFAVTLLEAMACQVPIVASDVAAVGPILGPIDPSARKLIVPVGDAVATASAIERALRLDGDARRQLGSRLRQFVQRNADYDTNMAKMEAIYRRLASRP